ncbi:NADH:flavin oxidoreductase [Photorhabdus heterorhabditis]|uniref:NADH:flavin oxidoreductase n=1 Tax=Photorhabdus heterorhabditis TaxID=880156 RepID=UPI001BD530EC|nr:NADH:flavin oxidoreductase [Photorhabdus heterorhabditis]MBS9440649.1 12-oxophytodienoate reductase [Photorhabdus heterorhabditis]
MDTHYAALFAPMSFGSQMLKNRIVMSPMTRQLSPNGIPGQVNAAYYRRRAEGGVGLIITEGVCIPHIAANGYADVPVMYGDEALNGWKTVVKQVHEYGALIIPQLWHVGPMRRPGIGPDPSVPGYGPMTIRDGDQTIVKGLNEKDIKDIIDAYVQAAKNALDIGFDGIEIHGAHEYLLDSFIWQVTNQRKDKYGGTFNNRIRLASEVVSAIRAATSPEFPIVFRFSQWKIRNYGAKIIETPDQLEKFVTTLVKAGVDVFDVSTRRFWEPAFEGSPDSLAVWTRRLSGKPTIMVGSVGLDKAYAIAQLRGDEKPDAGRADLAPAIELLASGSVDLVALGRMLLADPEWPTKVYEGRLSEIFPFDKSSMMTRL